MMIEDSCLVVDTTCVALVHVVCLNFLGTEEFANIMTEKCSAQPRPCHAVFRRVSDGTAAVLLLVRHVVIVRGSRRGNNGRRSGGFDWEGYRYITNQGGECEYHGGEQ